MSKIVAIRPVRAPPKPESHSEIAREILTEFLKTVKNKTFSHYDIYASNPEHIHTLAEHENKAITSILEKCLTQTIPENNEFSDEINNLLISEIDSQNNTATSMQQNITFNDHEEEIDDLSQTLKKNNIYSGQVLTRDVIPETPMHIFQNVNANPEEQQFSLHNMHTNNDTTLKQQNTVFQNCPANKNKSLKNQNVPYTSCNESKIITFQNSNINYDAILKNQYVTPIFQNANSVYAETLRNQNVHYQNHSILHNQNGLNNYSQFSLDDCTPSYNKPLRNYAVSREIIEATNYETNTGIYLGNTFQNNKQVVCNTNNYLTKTTPIYESNFAFHKNQTFDDCASNISMENHASQKTNYNIDIDTDYQREIPDDILSCDIIEETPQPNFIIDNPGMQEIMQSYASINNVNGNETKMKITNPHTFNNNIGVAQMNKTRVEFNEKHLVENELVDQNFPTRINKNSNDKTLIFRSDVEINPTNLIKVSGSCQKASKKNNYQLTGSTECQNYLPNKPLNSTLIFKKDDQITPNKTQITQTKSAASRTTSLIPKDIRKKTNNAKIKKKALITNRTEETNNAQKIYNQKALVFKKDTVATGTIHSAPKIDKVRTQRDSYNKNKILQDSLVSQRTVEDIFDSSFLEEIHCSSNVQTSVIDNEIISNYNILKETNQNVEKILQEDTFKNKNKLMENKKDLDINVTPYTQNINQKSYSDLNESDQNVRKKEGNENIKEDENTISEKVSITFESKNISEEMDDKMKATITKTTIQEDEHDFMESEINIIENENMDGVVNIKNINTQGKFTQQENIVKENIFETNEDVIMELECGFDKNENNVDKVKKVEHLHFSNTDKANVKYDSNTENTNLFDNNIINDNDTNIPSSVVKCPEKEMNPEIGNEMCMLNMKIQTVQNDKVEKDIKTCSSEHLQLNEVNNQKHKLSKSYNLTGPINSFKNERSYETKICNDNSILNINKTFKSTSDTIQINEDFINFPTILTSSKRVNESRKLKIRNPSIEDQTNNFLEKVNKFSNSSEPFLSHRPVWIFTDNSQKSQSNSNVVNNIKENSYKRNVIEEISNKFMRHAEKLPTGSGVHAGSNVLNSLKDNSCKRSSIEGNKNVVREGEKSPLRGGNKTFMGEAKIIERLRNKIINNKSNTKTKINTTSKQISKGISEIVPFIQKNTRNKIYENNTQKRDISENIQCVQKIILHNKTNKTESTSKSSTKMSQNDSWTPQKILCETNNTKQVITSKEKYEKVPILDLTKDTIIETNSSFIKISIDQENTDQNKNELSVLSNTNKKSIENNQDFIRSNKNETSDSNNYCSQDSLISNIEEKLSTQLNLKQKSSPHYLYTEGINRNKNYKCTQETLFSQESKDHNIATQDSFLTRIRNVFGDNNSTSIQNDEEDMLTTKLSFDQLKEIPTKPKNLDEFDVTNVKYNDNIPQSTSMFRMPSCNYDNEDIDFIETNDCTFQNLSFHNTTCDNNKVVDDNKKPMATKDTDSTTIFKVPSFNQLRKDFTSTEISQDSILTFEIQRSNPHEMSFKLENIETSKVTLSDQQNKAELNEISSSQDSIITNSTNDESFLKRIRETFGSQNLNNKKIKIDSQTENEHEICELNREKAQIRKSNVIDETESVRFDIFYKNKICSKAKSDEQINLATSERFDAVQKITMDASVHNLISEQVKNCNEESEILKEQESERFDLLHIAQMNKRCKNVSDNKEKIEHLDTNADGKKKKSYLQKRAKKAKHIMMEVSNSPAKVVKTKQKKLTEMLVKEKSTTSSKKIENLNKSVKKEKVLRQSQIDFSNVKKKVSSTKKNQLINKEFEVLRLGKAHVGELKEKVASGGIYAILFNIIFKEGFCQLSSSVKAEGIPEGILLAFYWTVSSASYYYLEIASSQKGEEIMNLFAFLLGPGVACRRLCCGAKTLFRNLLDPLGVPFRCIKGSPLRDPLIGCGLVAPEGEVSSFGAVQDVMAVRDHFTVTSDVLVNACRLMAVLLKVDEKLSSWLKKDGMEEVFRLDMSIVPVIADMEHREIKVNTDGPLELNEGQKKCAPLTTLLRHDLKRIKCTDSLQMTAELMANVKWGEEKESCSFPLRAGSGCELLVLNLRNLDIRIFAHLSNDKNLLEASNHWIGSRRDQRDKSEETVRAFLLCPEPKDFAGLLGIAVEEARSIMNGFSVKFPGLLKFRSSLINRCKKLGYVTSISGRRRRFHDIYKLDDSTRTRCERDIVEFVMGASTADIRKSLMAQLTLSGANLECHLLRDGRDELVWEVCRDHLQEAAGIIKRALSDVGALFHSKYDCNGFAIPVILSTGNNSAEMQSIII